MDPETHEIFVEKDVHFEERSPSLSSTPLRTSYTVETDSETAIVLHQVQTHGVLSTVAVTGHINSVHMLTFP